MIFQVITIIISAFISYKVAKYTVDEDRKLQIKIWTAEKNIEKLNEMIMNLEEIKRFVSDIELGFIYDRIKRFSNGEMEEQKKRISKYNFMPLIESQSSRKRYLTARDDFLYKSKLMYESVNKFVKQTSTNDRLKIILLTFDSKELADYFSFIDNFKALLEFCSENDFEKMKEFFAKENYLALFDATKNALMEKLDKDIDYIYEYIEEEKSKVAA